MKNINDDLIPVRFPKPKREVKPMEITKEIAQEVIDGSKPSHTNYELRQKIYANQDIKVELALAKLISEIELEVNRMNTLNKDDIDVQSLHRLLWLTSLSYTLQDIYPFEPYVPEPELSNEEIKDKLLDSISTNIDL